MSLLVSYDLTGRGWAECSVAVDKQKATVTASYLSDALADLLEAVSRSVEGDIEATVSFAEEPGEYRWTLTRKDAERVLVRIFFLNGESETIFEAECRLRTFAGAVLAASQQVLKKYGMEGYKGLWGKHEFPIEKQERLQKLLKQSGGC